MRATACGRLATRTNGHSLHAGAGISSGRRDRSGRPTQGWSAPGPWGAGCGAIMASLLAGRAYVPIGPDFPAQRQRYMLAAAGAVALVADSQFSTAAVQLADCVDLRIEVGPSVLRVMRGDKAALV